MLPFSALISNQINFLLKSVNESNYDSIHRELRQLVEHGREARTILLQICLDQVNYYSQDSEGLQVEQDLLSAIFKYILDKPNFCTTFHEAVGSAVISEGFLADLSNTLNLSTAEKIGVGLALSESETPDLRTKGQNFSIAQIEELCANPTSAISHKQIQDVVLFLYQSKGLSKHVDSFTKLLLLVPLKTNDIFVQSPVLSDDTGCVNSLRQMDLFMELSDHDFKSVLAEIEKEMSMADIIMELGYECTSNISHCREMLSLFLPLNEVTLSKLLGIISHTCISLDDTQNIHSVLCSALDCSTFCESLVPRSWNVDILVDSILQLAPTTNWISVMENLDHEGFDIPDDLSFSLLMSIYTKACQDPFPLHVICGSVWKNAEGQLSFLRHAVSAPSDVFTFAHCSRKLTHVDLTDFSRCDGNQAWSCLDLLNVLCQLAERGQINSVRLILECPLNKCPEVLLVGIAQINTPYNLLQYEVSSIVFPDILSDPTKIDVVHLLWRVNPSMVLRSFFEYIYTDPNNLFRIVEICQELKIMSSTLDKTPSPVSIRLAAVAYRKEFSILENWLNENMSIYKVAFFEDCLKFLKVVFCDADNEVPDMSLQQSLDAILNDYGEAYSVIFKVLQFHAREPSLRQSSEELQGLIISSNSKLQSPVSSNVLAANGISDSLKEEANSYFCHLFSGQLTVDAMVEKLACFKESSEKREQLLFNYMIANMFDEYKFFPNYAEGQLILAGILFGSLIKHQLLNYLQLGIALRGVLDALRKSVDSKMFIFGVKALGQFIDRLVEWPQYCNLILQLSDLRGTHPELVSVVERALSLCSSSYEESNAECSLPADQQLGSSSPTSSQSMELSEASSQLASSSSSLFEQQIFSFELQRTHQGFLPEQVKSSAIFANCTKSHPSDVQNVRLPPTPTDSITNLMVTTQSLHAPFEKSAPVSHAVSSSSCLLLSSCGTTAADLVRKSSYGTGFGAALNIETLVAAAEGKDTPIEVPASEVQDKILFMINNMSTTNIDSKARDFNEVLTEQYHPWFAQYMVMKRASIEPNFHDLYLKFLEKVNSKSLNKEIVMATYENCKVLLRSELIKSSSEERSLLKNLGSWLGKFTIGRNKALLAKEIDPKVLIIEAYEKGLMIAVIPFTSKILEPCYNSLAYKPPNPWTMGILGLLAEIYNLRNLKLNLKFDIEVLFKNLGLDIKTVTQTCFLKDRVREVEGNPDFSNKDTSLSGARGMFEVDSSLILANNHLELHPEYAASSQISHRTIVEDEGALIVPEHVRPAQGFTQAIPTCSLSQLLKSVPGWDQHMNIDSMVSVLQNSIVPAIMDMAIKEIIPHVTRHAIAVAIQTTKELVTKDCTLETDVCVAIRAAHLMVGNLAGNLAYVTSMGHLQMVLSNHLRRLLQTINFNGESMEQTLQILTTNNLYLGCERIKNIASEKAMEMVDEQIVSAFTTIRQQREIAGSAHVHTFANGSLTHDPEALGLKPGCISVAQKQVYNDFRRNLWQSSCSNSSSVLPAGPPAPSVSLSNSAQMNSDIVLASQVTPAQPAHLIQPDQSAQFRCSSSTTFSGPNDYVLQPNAGSISVTSFPASVTSNELDMVEASRLAKDVGADMVLSPLSLPMGAAVSETSSTARNPMDDYKRLEQEVSSLFSLWCQSCDLPATRHTIYAQFISLLQQIGFFRSGDIVDWLFHFLAELSVANCLALERAQTSDSLPIQSSQFQQLQYESIDAFAKLVVLILKNTAADPGSSKALLDKILTVIISVIHKDAEKKKTLFNPRPYFRLFVNWFKDLVTSDTVPDAHKFQVLTSFANAFHELHPEKVPSFRSECIFSKVIGSNNIIGGEMYLPPSAEAARMSMHDNMGYNFVIASRSISFAWVDLVCHKGFMPKLLTINNLSGWLLFKRLLVDLFKFMGPYLRDAKLEEPILVLYKGILRVLLILFHDFPEFLASFHFSFCDVIPHNCIQMRNLILTASPSNMKIPDPLTPNLKIDLLPDMSMAPCILSDVDGALKAKQIKVDVDEYLKTGPERSTFLTGLYQTLLLSQSESSLLGTVYDEQLINSLVLYVGMQDIQRLQGKHTIQPAPTSQVTDSLVDIFRHGAAMNIFDSLVKNLDEEGRYFFLNAVANQLRFPSSHTCYFSFVLLSLFETRQENIQEQITRVLLERCIAGPPLPWGLLATYIELSKNLKYEFWNRPFVQQAPEIKNLLEKVMVMCHNPTDDIRHIPDTNE